MSPNLNKICEVLDKLTIDALTLMEQEIQVKLELEKSMSDGEAHLAKSRYIMGQNYVSTLQLPTENSSEFNASAVLNVEENSDVFSDKTLDLEFKKDDQECKNPLRWFGVFVPQNLHYAQAKFKQALVWAAKSANIQIQLNNTLSDITKLESIKRSASC